MITKPRTPDILVAAAVGRFIQESFLRPAVWRHHKIGVLQAYLVEAAHDGDREVRVHVWHPSLKLSDEDSGVMHDHRFDLTSDVLVGAMHDTEIALRAVERSYTGEIYEVWDIQNARSAQANGGHWVRKSETVPGAYVLHKVKSVYAQGARYGHPRGQFHRSEVTELTVTVCTKTNQVATPARLLARVGSEPKHGFDPSPNHGGIGTAQARLLVEAADLLTDIARGHEKP